MNRLRNAVWLFLLFLFVLVMATPTSRLEGERLLYMVLFSGTLALIFADDWRRIRSEVGRLRFSQVVAGLLGAIAAVGVVLTLSLPLVAWTTDAAPLVTVAMLCAAVLGAAIGGTHARSWAHLLSGGSKAVGAAEDTYLLDTSSLIDGRILTLLERGILVGNLYVTEFALRELQRVADDDRSRERGRRGLDVVAKLRASGKLVVSGLDVAQVQKIDDKLVALAKRTGYTLVTVDTNLKLVAALQEVPTLSLHELTDALRRRLFVGDRLELDITQKGTRTGQGVGYLDDGTMICVNNAAGVIGQRISIVIEKIVPGEKGRLLFAARVPSDSR